MKKLVLFCLAALFCVAVSAQKVYFLYLQSDDQTAFYVKMGNKIYSSAASGFLILPNLKDSTYQFGLGLARSASPESTFSLTINQNDRGFLIKNMAGELALFDMQDLTLVKANSGQPDNTIYETKTDRFSAVLSKAAGDPNLLKVPVGKKEDSVKNAADEKGSLAARGEAANATVSAPPAADSAKQPVAEQASVAALAQEVAVGGIVLPDTVIVTPAVKKEMKEVAVDPVPQESKRDLVEEPLPAFRRSVVSRQSESSTTEGFGLIYFDKREGGTDTIRILIPAPRTRLVAENEPPVPERIDTLVSAKSETLTTVPEAASVSPAPATNIVACKSIASDKDFLKLRKRMAARENNDDMLDEARKEFRGKCYTVEQVRYLSSLFLTSASKYQFFDAAYNAVSDRANFSSLGAEIKDDHYARRFKALIGE